MLIASSKSSGTKLRSRGAARYRNGGRTRARSCRPIATFLRPRPTAQWSDSCSPISEMIASSSRARPRTTADPRYGRISARPGSTENAMPEGEAE